MESATGPKCRNVINLETKSVCVGWGWNEIQRTILQVLNLKSYKVRQWKLGLCVKTQGHTQTSVSAVACLIHKGHCSLVFFIRVKGKGLTCWGQHALVNKTINSSLHSLTQPVSSLVKRGNILKPTFIPFLNTSMAQDKRGDMHMYMQALFHPCKHRKIRLMVTRYVKSFRMLKGSFIRLYLLFAHRVWCSWVFEI